MMAAITILCDNSLCFAAVIKVYCKSVFYDKCRAMFVQLKFPHRLMRPPLIHSLSFVFAALQGWYSRLH